MRSSRSLYGARAAATASFTAFCWSFFTSAIIFATASAVSGVSVVGGTGGAGGFVGGVGVAFGSTQPSYFFVVSLTALLNAACIIPTYGSTAVIASVTFSSVDSSVKPRLATIWSTSFASSSFFKPYFANDVLQEVSTFSLIVILYSVYVNG